MAMPAMAILETGQPVLPSGMYYARALLNIYLMSGAVWLFGESEWAFRLPSAIVGSFTGLAAFYMGRRFLPPLFNIAFVAAIVLLPAMIEMSQTARMYVFFVTFVIWFAACIFRWERDQRLTSLGIALVVWCLALHFQTLAIFVAPLFIFPGLSRHSWTQLFQGIVAFFIGGLFFVFYDNWISAKYPQSSDRPPAPEADAPQTALDALTSGNEWLLLVCVLVIAFLTLTSLLKFAGRSGQSAKMPLILVAIGLLAIASLYYHIGGILLFFSAILWLRNPNLPRSWLIGPVMLAVMIAVVHLVILHETGLYPGRKLIGAVIGVPSVWPMLRLLQYSPIAGVLYGIVLLFALKNFAAGKRLPVHFLFFAIAVWIPLLIIGFFKWNVPPRYTLGQLGFFLLCTFTGLSYIAGERRWMEASLRAKPLAIGALVLVCAAVVNPVLLGRTVNPSYERFPDHKGAAEFIQSLSPQKDVILIAEDALQQTYYLGAVDYWLREFERSRRYSIMRDGTTIDQYTGAVTLGTGAELTVVLDQSLASDLYIIGSGENFVNGKRLFRGQGIADVLESDRLEVVFTGRDNKTRVWKLVR
jgi:hypothetical protein